MTPTGPRADRSLLAFYVLAFAISWGALGALQVIATTSGAGTWQDLARSAETTFDLAARTSSLPVPVWLVRALGVLADFGPSLAAVLVAGATGRLRPLLARLGRWRVAPGTPTWTRSSTPCGNATHASWRP